MTTRPPQQVPDDEVRRAWREISNEQPPERVDAAVLAAARRAADPGFSSVVRTEDRPRTRRWFQRWQPALAAAGVCGLAFVLLQSLPRESGIGTTPTRSIPSVPSEATREISSGPPAPVAAQTPAPATSGDFALTDRAVMAAPAAKAVSGDADAERAAPLPATEARERVETGNTVLGAAREPSASTYDDSIDAAIARITELCDRGDRDGAAAELRRLRTQSEHADERLPERLRAWARTVP